MPGPKSRYTPGPALRSKCRYWFTHKSRKAARIPYRNSNAITRAHKAVSTDSADELKDKILSKSAVHFADADLFGTGQALATDRLV